MTLGNMRGVEDRIGSGLAVGLNFCDAASETAPARYDLSSEWKHDDGRIARRACRTIAKRGAAGYTAGKWII